MLPLFKVFVADHALDQVNQVLMSGYIGEGPIVAKFEDRFSRYIHNPGKVVATNSGTSAITMALRLAGVEAGDTVVTTPMTCLATNIPILTLGAIPIWADILKDGTIDPEDVKIKLDMSKNEGRKTKAIICMDWGGLPCKLNELRAIADRFGIALIHDACQSVGGGYNEKPTGGGSPAHYICYSFQAIKHLTTGDGGVIVVNTNESELYQARLMKWFGLDRTKSESLRCGQDPPLVGYKFQMNDIAAAIGLANMDNVCWVVRKTRAHAQQYNRKLQDCKNVKIIPFDSSRGRSGHWLYTCFVEDQKDFSAYMAKNDIMASKVHDRNDTKTIFQACHKEKLPGVDYFDSHHICIPVGWWVLQDDIDKIVDLCHQY